MSTFTFYVQRLVVFICCLYLNANTLNRKHFIVSITLIHINLYIISYLLRCIGNKYPSL